jgi:hypothetical protein
VGGKYCREKKNIKTLIIINWKSRQSKINININLHLGKKQCFRDGNWQKWAWTFRD